MNLEQVENIIEIAMAQRFQLETVKKLVTESGANSGYSCGDGSCLNCTFAVGLGSCPLWMGRKLFDYDQEWLRVHYKSLKEAKETNSCAQTNAKKEKP